MRYLLFGSVFAEQWYQYSFSRLECQGLPDSISLYQNLTISRAVEKYTAYGWVIEPFCGTTNTLLETQYCCRSSINRIYSEGLGSFVMDPRRNVPKLQIEATSGVKYVKLSSNETDYVEQYVALNVCTDYRYFCNETHVKIYPERQCQGTPEIHAVGDIQSTTVGRLHAILVHLQIQPQKYIWTTVFPPTDFVPLHTHTIEYFGTAFYIVALLICVGYTFHYLYRFLSSKKGHTLNLTGLTHFVLFLGLGMNFWFWYLIIDSVLLYDVLVLLHHLMMNMSTYCSVLINAFITGSLVEQRFHTSKYVSYSIYAGVTFVHLVLRFPTYIITSQTEKGLRTTLLRWSRESGVTWYLSMIAFDSIVGMYTAMELLRVIDKQELSWSDILVKCAQDNFFVTVAGSQITIFGLYVTNWYVQNRTYLYASQYGLYAAAGLNALLIAVHTLIVSHTYNHYTVMVKQMIISRSKDQKRIALETSTGMAETRK